MKKIIGLVFLMAVGAMAQKLVMPPGIQVVGDATNNNVMVYQDGSLIDSGVAPTNLVVVSNQLTVADGDARYLQLSNAGNGAYSDTNATIETAQDPFFQNVAMQSEQVGLHSGPTTNGTESTDPYVVVVYGQSQTSNSSGEQSPYVGEGTIDNAWRYVFSSGSRISQLDWDQTHNNWGAYTAIADRLRDVIPSGRKLVVVMHNYGGQSIEKLTPDSTDDRWGPGYLFGCTNTWDSLTNTIELALSTNNWSKVDACVFAHGESGGNPATNAVLYAAEEAKIRDELRTLYNTNMLWITAGLGPGYSNAMFGVDLYPNIAKRDILAVNDPLTRYVYMHDAQVQDWDTNLHYNPAWNVQLGYRWAEALAELDPHLTIEGSSSVQDLTVTTGGLNLRRGTLSIPGYPDVAATLDSFSTSSETNTYYLQLYDAWISLSVGASPLERISESSSEFVLVNNADTDGRHPLYGSTSWAQPYIFMASASGSAAYSDVLGWELPVDANTNARATVYFASTNDCTRSSFGMFSGVGVDGQEFRMLEASGGQTDKFDYTYTTNASGSATLGTAVFTPGRGAVGDGAYDDAAEAYPFETVGRSFSLVPHNTGGDLWIYAVKVETW